MMALEEYEALQETAHLLSSPANAARLMESLKELKAGKGKERHLTQE
jgi:antitoxin YefM